MLGLTATEPMLTASVASSADRVFPRAVDVAAPAGSAFLLAVKLTTCRTVSIASNSLGGSCGPMTIVTGQGLRAADDNDGFEIDCERNAFARGRGRIQIGGAE